jgi:hypothetical protein
MATSTVPQVRTWTRVLLAMMLMALGVWVFLLPLAGPYFGFGFDTTARWRFSQPHWVTGLAAGAAIFLGGALVMSRRRPLQEIGGLAALTGGVWLVVVPSLHQVWSPTALAPQPAGAWHTAWLWIGYFYGPGALAIYLSARAQALSRRGDAYDSPATQPPRQPQAQSTSAENQPSLVR